MEKPLSKYILVKAMTKSEWDQCDYALIRITETWISTMQMRIEASKSTSDSPGFYCNVYWDAPYRYLNIEDSLLPGVFPNDQSWGYIALHEDDVDNFQEPQSQFDSEMMFVNVAGQIHYMSYGKNTGEEYSTAVIDVLKVIHDFKSEELGN